ncbi:8-oxo-dGTP pyrophosphatase MutT (NUDIX family) [Neorhizobium sp. 2083]|uniref:NUDIX hydrolase n=1 Tax=Neorhizobium sp. 2083 TaxID=2817762 RepID=UPI0028666D26|nr:NUDIX hydrolase [Neorhizobium sp. 2083]MDR6818440.1 8-oxo-dGTP pyrophosphatase MutT (NUDIX family) [Neorhizobium sp. 2083]
MTIQATGGWPAENTVFEVEAFDLSVLPGPHPLYAAHQSEIEANWELEAAANPHLFNGQMVLQNRLSFRDGVIVGEAHVIPYSTLLWWRKQRDPAGAFHLFGFAVLVSSDGAIIAVRMSERTANPGQVYCAAGSLDLLDIVDGKLDLQANMRREVLEETGLDLDEARVEPQFFASHSGHRVVGFRFYRFDLAAEQMLARIAAHMVHDEEKEIAGAVAIRSADRGAHPYSTLMFPILDLFFGHSMR